MRISDWSSDVCSSDLVETHRLRLSPDNALDLVARYDLVADGSDNFPTRYLANDACHLAGRPLVSAAIMRFDGQPSTRSEERRVGKECVSTCRSRWSPYN